MSIDWSVYPNFTEEEFRCKCGECGEASMDPLFMTKLQNIRNFVGFPITISSGYRCPEYNDAISSSGRAGPHTSGKASDLQVSGGEALQVIMAALTEGLTGIGLNQRGPHLKRFLHLDLLEGSPQRPRPWVWTY